MSYLFARGGRFYKLNWMLVVTLWALAALGELRLQPPEMGSDGRVRIRLDGLLPGQAARIEQIPGLGNTQAPSVVVQGRPDQAEFILPPGGPIESYYRAVADSLQAVAVPQLRVPEALMTIPAGQVLRLAPSAFLTSPRPAALNAAVLTVAPVVSGVAGDQLRLSTQGVIETRGGKDLYLEGRLVGTLQLQGSRLVIAFAPWVSGDAIEAVARQVELLPSAASLESGYRIVRWELDAGPGAPSHAQMQTVHVTQDCGQPTDIVVVLDRSPKLLQTEMNQVKAAVRQFIQNYPLQKGVQQIGLVSFCGAGFIHEPLTADRDRLLLSLSRIDRGARLDKIGCEETFVGSGLERALRLLTNASSRRLMILLTPGQEVALNGDVAQRSADSEFLAGRARALGVRVLTYGLGRNPDAAHLRRLAADVDSFYPIPNVPDLQPALLQLAGSTCTPESPFPIVDPGSDAVVWLPKGLELSGHCEGCTPLAVGGWIAEAGPGPVSLEGWGMNPVARFQSPGRYSLQLHVTDRGFHASQTLHVTVLQSNLPPVLQASAYQVAPRQVLLAGEVSDDRVGSDGFLSAAPVRCQWSQTSGPAQATLDNALALRTFADLPAPGSYEFALEAIDAGGLSMRRRVEVRALDDTKPQVFSGVGYVSAAVGGLRDVGAGSLHLQGVRGSVLKAFLVWHGPVDSLNPQANAFVTLNGHWIEGRSIGMSHDDQWLYAGDHSYLSGQAYQADVTPWVQKDGDYTLDHGAKSPQININGASLMVVFEEPVPERRRDVTLWMGNDSNGEWSPALNDAVSAIAVQKDQRVLLAGAFTEAGGFTRWHLARLLPDGQLDQSFDPETQSTDVIHCLTIDPSGACIAGGRFRNGTQTRGLARWSVDGSRDRAFGASLPEDIEVACLAFAPGTLWTGGPQGLWRLNEDGTAIRVLEGEVRALLSARDGSLWIGGALKVDGQTVSLARLTANSRIEATASLPDGDVLALAATTDGRVMVGGRFHRVQGEERQGVARFLENGRLDLAWVPTALNEGGDQEIRAIQVQADDSSTNATGARLVLGGHLRVKSDSGVIDLALLRLTDGEYRGDHFEALPRRVDDEVHAVSPVAEDGTFWIGGRFVRQGIVNRMKLNQEGQASDQNRGDQGWSQTFAVAPDAGVEEIELHVSDGQSSNQGPYWDPTVFLNGQTWLQPAVQRICDEEQEQLFSGNSVPNAHHECSENLGLWDVIRSPVPSSLKNAKRLWLTSGYTGASSAEDLVTLVSAALVAPSQGTNALRMVRGPLTMRDDQYVINRSAGPRRLAVLQNDSVPQGGRIVSVSSDGTNCVSIDELGSSLLFRGSPEAWARDGIAFDYVFRQTDGMGATGHVSLRLEGSLPTLLEGASGSLVGELASEPSPSRGPHHASQSFRLHSDAPESLYLTVDEPEFPGHLYLRDPEGQIQALDWHESESFGIHAPRASRLQISTQLSIPGDYWIEVAGNRPEDRGGFELRWERFAEDQSPLLVSVEGMPLQEDLELGSLEYRARAVTLTLLNRSQSRSLSTRLSVRSYAAQAEVSVREGEFLELPPGGSAKAVVELRLIAPEAPPLVDVGLSIDGDPAGSRNSLLHFHSQGATPRLALKAERLGVAVVRLTASALDGQDLTGLVFIAESKQGQRIFPADGTSYRWSEVPPGDYRLWARADQGLSQRLMLNATQIIPEPVTRPDRYQWVMNSGPQPLTVLSNDVGALRLVQVLGGTLGAVGTNAEGQVIYEPYPHVLGHDQLRYVAMDANQMRYEEDVFIEIVRPRVWILEPENDAVVTVGAPVTIKADVDAALGASAETRLWMEDRLVARWDKPPFEFVWTPAKSGFYRLRAETLDASGAWQRSSLVTVGVSTLGDHAPTAEIQYPSADAFVREGVLDVTGIASDPDGPVAYTLTLQTAQGETLQTISHGPGEPLTALGRFDLTQLRNGIYELLLTVTEGIGTAEHSVRFALQSELKLGRLTFGETDLQIQAEGLPLTLMRRYDSLDPTGGDFGPGWRMDLYDLDVELDEQRETLMDEDLQETFQMRTGGGRNLSLTLPGGPRLVFAFSLRPGASDGGVPCFCYQAEWNPVAGLPVTLTALGNRELRFLPFQNTLPPFWVDAGPGTPFENYDFKGWVLTNADGTAFELERPLEGRHALESEGPILKFVDTYGAPRLRRVRARTGESVEIQGSERVDHLNALGERTRSLVLKRESHGYVKEVFGPESVESDGGLKAGSRPLIRYDYAGEPAQLVAVHRLQDRSKGRYLTQQYAYTNQAFPHYLTDVRDARGVSVLQNRFDEQGRLTEVVDAKGARTRMLHRLETREEELINPLGQRSLHQYDPNGNVVRSISPAGAVTVRVFDERNQPIAETNAVGTLAESWLLRGFDDQGRVTAVTNAAGIERMGYDSAGLLIWRVAASGIATTNHYDAAGRLTNSVVGGGSLRQESRWLYDAKGRLQRFGELGGRVTELAYDSWGNATEERSRGTAGEILHEVHREFDPLGNLLNEGSVRHLQSGLRETNTSRYGYDAQNRRIAQTNALGHVRLTRYGIDGLIESERDELERVTVFHRDRKGLLVQTLLPTDAETPATLTRSVYDALGRKVYEIQATELPVGVDPLHSVIVSAGSFTEYDPEGRVSRTGRCSDLAIEVALDAEGIPFSRLVREPVVLAATETHYDALGRVSWTRDPMGVISEFFPDAAGRPSISIHASGTPFAVTNRFIHNPDGTLAATVDGAGNRTDYVYDSLQKRIQTLFPEVDGQRSSVYAGYDSLGRHLSDTNELGIVTAYGYDLMGYLTSVTNALGTTNQTVTRYEYDENGHPLRQIDALGRTTRFEYDALGRRLWRQLPGKETERFEYDAVGNLLRHTHFNGRVVEQRFDALNRVLRKVEKVPSGDVLQAAFTYTATGQRRTQEDPSGPCSYEYDAFDRLQVKRKPGWGTFTYDYRADGRVQSIWIDAAGESWEQRYEYDPLGRLQGASMPGFALGATYRYDAAGNLGGVAYVNGLTNRQDYDARGRLRSLVWHWQGEETARFDYRVNPAGMRTNLWESLSAGGAESREYRWSYDPLQRLTAEVISGQVDARYRYDAVGNRLERVSATPQLSSQQLRYDQNDRLDPDDDPSNANPNYDADGNPVHGVEGDQPYEDVYDAEDRLIERRFGKTTTSQSTTTESSPVPRLALRYDADGTQLERVLTAAPSDLGGEVPAMRFVVEDQNPTGLPQTVAILEGSGESDWVLRERLLWGQECVGQVTSRAGENETMHWVTDGRGSVRGEARGQTQPESGTTYDAWGVALKGSSAVSGVVSLARGYLGEWQDVRRGAYLLRARDYLPELGRFRTRDSYEGRADKPVSLGGYLYAHVDPVNLKDPTGHSVAETLTSTAMMAYLRGSQLMAAHPFFAMAAVVGVSVALPGLEAIPPGSPGPFDEMGQIGKAVRLGNATTFSTVARFFRYGNKSIPTTSLVLGQGDDLAKAVSWVVPKPGYLDVIVHGSEESFHVLHNGEWVSLSHRSLAKFMKNNGYRGGPVRLISCSAGGYPHGVAKDLANKLGAEVLAPTDTLWVHPSGRLTIGPTDDLDTGKWRQFLPGL